MLVTVKKTRKAMRTVSARMACALEVALTEFSGEYVRTQRVPGYSHADTDSHKFSIERTAYGRGSVKRVDGFLIFVVRRSIGKDCYHNVDVYSFKTKADMFRAYNYLWAAYKNA